jgi:PhnB protein
MKVHASLSFDGNCEEAFRYYEKVLRGKIEVIFTYGDSAMAKQAGPDWKKKVIQVRLTIGDSAIMGSDTPDRYEKPQGISVSIGENNVGDAERLFNALADGGTVQMEFQKTFWAAGFSMLVDRFGIPWMVNCEQSN